MLQRIQDELAKAQEHDRLPGVVVVSVQEQLQRIESVQDDIDQLYKRLASLVKQNQQMQALQYIILGIGPLTASALVATATDLTSFE